MRKIECIAVFAALAIATPAMAQGRGRGNGGVPPGQRPPAGMCRIWIDGLPPGHQPAPTDCATAAARVPYNGRIIYGDQTSRSRRRVYDSNGQVIPNGQVITNGQGCIRRADRNGRIQTICPDNDNDRDDRISSRVYSDQNRIVNEKGKVKHKKHKGDRDRDNDEDRIRDRNR